jgi:gamma-glutamylcyclotransferase (GGCT)/AIG2-like uncharacterized protein YtfP
VVGGGTWPNGAWQTISGFMSTLPSSVLLFSYGTLQDKDVQMANFGRELAGRADALPGYAFTNPVLSDESQYANIKLSSNPEDAVSGTVFEITEHELAAADRYEEDADYHRILVTLRSGDHAWVYRRA